MGYVAGTQVVTVAGTAEPLTNDLPDNTYIRAGSKIKSINVRARTGNTGAVYFGIVNVSSTYGWELDPGDSKEESFGAGSVLFSAFYVDAETAGNQLDWSVITES